MEWYLSFNGIFNLRKLGHERIFNLCVIWAVKNAGQGQNAAHTALPIVLTGIQGKSPGWPCYVRVRSQTQTRANPENVVYFRQMPRPGRQ